MARFSTATTIINRAAVEVGLTSVVDPVNSEDSSFIQLTELLNGAGQELVELHAWQGLVATYQLTTTALDTGEYALPDDFSYMIDQTGWELSNAVPLGGPLSAQDWTYLAGRNLVSQTIYASFRFYDDKFNIFPQDPVTAGLDINFEYISRNWVTEQTTGTMKDYVTIGSDIVMYEAILIIKFLKLKFLESKGFDASSAKTEFEILFFSRTGKDTGAPILSASGRRSGIPFLSPYRNTPDSGYGG